MNIEKIKYVLACVLAGVILSLHIVVCLMIVDHVLQTPDQHDFFQHLEIKWTGILLIFILNQRRIGRLLRPSVWKISKGSEYRLKFQRLSRWTQNLCNGLAAFIGLWSLFNIRRI